MSIHVKILAELDKRRVRDSAAELAKDMERLGNDASSGFAKGYESVGPKVRRSMDQVLDTLNNVKTGERDLQKVMEQRIALSDRMVQSERKIETQGESNARQIEELTAVTEGLSKARYNDAAATDSVVKQEAHLEDIRKQQTETTNRLRKANRELRDLRALDDPEHAKRIRVIEDEIDGQTRLSEIQKNLAATAVRDLASVKAFAAAKQAELNRFEQSAIDLNKVHAAGIAEVSQATKDLTKAQGDLGKLDESAIRQSENIDRLRRREITTLRALREEMRKEEAGGGSGGGGRSGGGGGGGRRRSGLSTTFSAFPGVPGGLPAVGAGAVLSGIVGVAGIIAKAVVTASESLWLLPAATTAAAAGFGTLAIATHGFGDAIQHMGDPKKFAEALATLSPNAQQAALQIKTLVDGPLGDLKRATQDTFFSGISEELHNLAGQYTAPLSQLTTSIAASFNTAFHSIGDELMQPETAAVLQHTFQNISTAFQQMSPAATNIVKAFTTLTDVGSNFLPGLAKGITGLTEKFAGFIENAAQTGKLQEWIQNGLDAAKELGEAIWDIGKKIYDAFAVDNMGDFREGLHRIVDLIGGLADGISTLASIANILAEFPGLIGAVVVAFAAWKTLSGISSVLESLGLVSSALAALPETAATAGAGISAGLNPVLAAIAVGLGGIYYLSDPSHMPWHKELPANADPQIVDQVMNGIPLHGPGGPTGDLGGLLNAPAPGQAPSTVGPQVGPLQPGWTPGATPTPPGVTNIGPFNPNIPVPTAPETSADRKAKIDAARAKLNAGDFAVDPFAGAGGAVPSAPGGHLANWDEVAKLEAGGNWATNTGNGFFGGLQFTPSSWAAAGGTQFAPSAEQASPEQQKSAADKLLQMQGPGAWPNTLAPHPEWLASSGAGGGVSTPSMAGMNLGNIPSNQGTNQAISAIAMIAKRDFGLDLTSGKRADAMTASGKSYHLSGEAGDFGIPGMETNDPRKEAFARWIQQFTPYLAEEIYSDPNTPDTQVGDGKNVTGTGYYGADTLAEHKNHVHVAIKDSMQQQFLGALGAGSPQVQYGNGNQPYGQMGYGYYDVDQAQVLSAKNTTIERAHKLQEDKMDLAALENSGVATEEELQKAKWAVYQDGLELNEAQGRLAKEQQGTWKKLDGSANSFSKGMQKLGADIDADFGISKGLPGIVENITKFLANIAMAPVLGALSGVTGAYGTAGPGTGILGAFAPRQNAFGQVEPNIQGQYLTTDAQGNVVNMNSMGLPGTPGGIPASGPGNGTLPSAPFVPPMTPPPTPTGPTSPAAPATPGATGAADYKSWYPNAGATSTPAPSATPVQGPGVGTLPSGAPVQGPGVGPSTASNPLVPTPVPGGGGTATGLPGLLGGGAPQSYNPGSPMQLPNATGSWNTPSMAIPLGQGMPNSPGISLSGGGILGAAGQAISSAAGLAAGAFSGGAGGAGASAAAQIGIDLMNRGISYGAQVAGIGVQGIMETFLPVESQLADPTRGWLGRIVGGVAGVRPVAQNLAGAMTKSGKDQTGDKPGAGDQPLSPEQIDKQKAKDAQANTSNQNNNVNIDYTSHGATPDENAATIGKLTQQSYAPAGGAGR